jgi:hypothetical protein
LKDIGEKSFHPLNIAVIDEKDRVVVANIGQNAMIQGGKPWPARGKHACLETRRAE